MTKTSLKNNVNVIITSMVKQGLRDIFMPMAFDSEVSISISLKTNGYILRVNSAEHVRDNIWSVNGLVNSVTEILLRLSRRTRRAVINYTGRLNQHDLAQLCKIGNVLYYNMGGKKILVKAAFVDLEWQLTTLDAHPVKWWGFFGVPPRVKVIKHDVYDNIANRKLTWF